MSSISDAGLAHASPAVTDILPDPEEAARARAERTYRTMRIVLPIAALVLALVAWELFSRGDPMRAILLPPPSKVLATLVAEAPSLFGSLAVTLRLTLTALAVAIVGGVGLAVLFSQSRIVEATFFPFAVVLQVTPIIAIAPLIIIYADSAFTAALICAWIVAFFPILSNTTLGLNSADHGLLALFKLYGANRWQTMWLLKLPSALPYFLGGLRIAGGLALIGAVVAEFVIGVNGAGLGLASRILEAGYRLQYPKMFAALLLIMGAGIVIFLAFTALSHVMLRKWHESALKRET